MDHSPQLDALGAALAKAQAQVKGAKKDAANPFFKSSYADLASVWEACREALTSNGLSVVQLPGYENGLATVDTILLHSSGQWISGKAGAPLAKQDAQGVGSVTTYLRRYALQSVAGVASEDDDGNAASKTERGGAVSRARGRPTSAAGPGPGVVGVAPTIPNQRPTAAELSEKPLAIVREQSEAMPWAAELKWKDKPLKDFASKDLITLRDFCEKKDPKRYAAELTAIEELLASRDGE